MSKKAFYTWEQVEEMTQDIIRKLHVDQLDIDCVVGLTRGGLTPAVLVSQYLDIPMHAVKVSLRDHIGEDNLTTLKEEIGITKGKRVLVIDDINDTGATLSAIKDVWGTDTVTYAVLINNEASAEDVDYSSIDINKHEENVWQVFPWEDWWLWN